MRMTTTASTFMMSAILIGSALGASLAMADDDNKRSNVNVSFGRGLNTAQPGNAVNHVVLPNEIKVKVGGVVDFGIAGFHDIIIFMPGVRLQDLIDAGGGQLPTFPPVFVLPPDPTVPLPPNLAFLADKIYYRGINPAGGPAANPPVANPDNSMNRREPVSFLEAGTYLVQK
jgi:hypothetical protein